MRPVAAGERRERELPSHAKRTSRSSIQHGSAERGCGPEVTFVSQFDIGIGFKEPEFTCLRSFEMNLQQACRVSSCCVGWRRIVVFGYDYSLSPGSNPPLKVNAPYLVAYLNWTPIF